MEGRSGLKKCNTHTHTQTLLYALLIPVCGCVFTDVCDLTLNPNTANQNLRGTEKSSGWKRLRHIKIVLSSGSECGESDWTLLLGGVSRATRLGYKVQFSAVTASVRLV